LKRTKYVTSELGFDCIGTFVLPESAWWNDYYHPFEKRLEEMKEKYLEIIILSDSLRKFILK